MTSTVLIGSTGLVGRHILEILDGISTVSSIMTISRRSPAPSQKVNAVVATDTSTWATALLSTSPPSDIYFSALGTSKGQAGSVAAQRLIDYDLNLALAKAAQKSGTKICVLVSSAGASATSRLAYTKMKGELDEVVQELGFETVVILRPGLIVGSLKDRSLGQFIAGNVAGAMGMLKPGLKDMWAQDADVIARAAVKSGLLALVGKAPTKVWILGQADVVGLGKEDLELKSVLA